MRRLCVILMMGALVGVSVAPATAEDLPVPTQSVQLFSETLTTPSYVPFPTIPPVVWATTTVTIALNPGDSVVLSSSPDGQDGWAIDDDSLWVNDHQIYLGPDNVFANPYLYVGQSVTNYYKTFDPLDVTDLISDHAACGGTFDVTWELVDVGVFYGSTALYLDVFSGPVQQWCATPWTEGLVDIVESMNLDNGISNALDAKLANAVKALDDVNESSNVAAVNKLEAFINEVEAQSGKQVSVEDATDLILKAQQVIDLLTA